MISKSASTALATMGTVCWCIQLIPQIWYNWRRKDCTGLPTMMMLLWTVSGIPFGIYFVISDGDIALQVQPHLFMFFCSVSFVQTCYYPPVKMARRRILILVLALIAADVGMEVGFILWLRPLYRKGTHWPALIFGIIASVCLAVGLVPPYFELGKRRGRVVGINFVFLFVDSMGAWLSIVSIVVGNMDVMSIALYCVVAAMELGIFLSHFIWCCRFKWFGHSDPDEGETDDHANNASKEGRRDQTSELDADANVTGRDKYELTCVQDTVSLAGSSIGERITSSRYSQQDRNLAMSRSVHGVSLQREVQPYRKLTEDED